MLTTDQVLGKGRYRIISNFTQDETGALYEAYDTVSNSNVVLRETSGSGVMNPTDLDERNSAFEGEAKVLAEVRHESLLSVQDYFSDIDRHYLVMESVDGCDLTKFLDPGEKRPSLSDVVKWADQVLAALDYLHNLANPIVHRDVRPANIRLTSNFKVKLLTAGICSSDVIMASAGNPSDASVLNYRPLEQLWGGLDAASQKVISNSYDDRSRKILQQPLDARSDIYAVGATVYHLLTRTLPKDALERSIEILDGNSDPLQPPAEIDSSIPEEVSEVIMKSMELRREHRYDSAAIMRQVLGAAEQRSKIRISGEAEPPSPPFLEAKKEKKAAKPLRQVNTQESVEKPAVAEDLLLEVEPVKTSGGNFEWSVDVSEQPSRSGADVKAFAQGSEELDFNLEPAPSSNMKVVIAGAGALVVVVAILGWLFMGGSSQPEPAKAPVAVQQQPAVQEQQPPAASTSQAAAVPEQVPQIAETVTVDGHQDTKAATKEKKPTPTPAKAPEKKKVTVDDLINDN